MYCLGEMRIGRVRGEVVKISKGNKFANSLLHKVCFPRNWLSLFKLDCTKSFQLNFRDRVDSNSIQQSKRFDKLDDQTKQIAISLLDFRESITEDFDRRILAVSQLINRREVVIVNHIYPTERLILNAFGTSDQNIPLEINNFQARIEKVRLEEAEILEHAARTIIESLRFPKI